MEKIEAQRKIPVIDVDNYNIVHTLVEDIYKDFSKQKCKSCKKSTPVYDMSKRLQGYYCKDPLFKDSFFELPKTFGCNKWKKNNA